MKTTNKKKLVALALVPVLGAAAIAGSAFAAEGTSSTTTGATSSWMGKIMNNFHRGGRPDSAQFANDLASVLGLSATDVKAKLDAGQTPQSIITATGKNVADVQSQLKTLHQSELKAQLDAKVAAGTLTQAQENTILTNMQNGTGRGFGHMKWSRDNTQFANDLASVLGLSATDVKAKLDAGQTPQSIITASGKNLTDVQAALRTLHINNLKTKLEADVAAGKMTQAQADAIITRESSETNNGFGMGMGRGMGHKLFGTSTR